MSERAKATTSVSLAFRLTDATTGAAKTGLDVTTLKLQYWRPGAAAGTATSLTLLALQTTTWTSYGAIEADATNSPGVYRVDCPDLAFATGADEVTLTVTGTAIQPASRLIDLTAFDSRNGTNGALTNLDATVSSRSTYAGGAVLSVTNPVTVGTNTDKTGYSLAITPPTAAQNATAVWTDTTSSDFTATGTPGKILVAQLGGTFTTATSSIFASPALINAPGGSGSDPFASDIHLGYSGTQAGAVLYSLYNLGVKLTAAGLDTVQVEAGINARQALSPILAAAAGVSSGQSTTTPKFQAAGNPGTDRITATLSGDNRTAVVLNLPT